MERQWHLRRPELSPPDRTPCAALALGARWALSASAPSLKFSLAQMLRKQLRILTSWTMSIQAQRACAEFVIERGIDLDRLFTDRWKLDQAEEAYWSFNRQSGGKGVFLM
ncbi:Zinc-binding dehydrogenase (plasmid) [Bradyrhizobium guangxiense]